MGEASQRQSSDNNMSPSENIKKSSAEASKKSKLISMVLLVMISTSTGFLGGWLSTNSRLRNSLLSKNQEEKQQIVLNESQLISEIAKQVGPSVVSINVTRQSMGAGLFGRTQTFVEEGAGTGLIIDSSGLVVTNRHVVPRGTSKVSITLSDGTELEEVEVVGRTSDSDPLDVAFLRIKNKKDKELQAAKLGDSSKVQVGDKVIAIGNALGQFQNTVTSGIISGYGRNVEASNGQSSETLQNLFQTDTAINQGNSGGPLVNINGEVIGINTAVAGNAENIGFAIPMNDLSGLIKSVIEKGRLVRPYLGVRYLEITDDLAFQLNLPVKRGALIAPESTNADPSVLPGSPAERAGLKPGDIITKMGNININETNSLVSVLNRFNVDEMIQLTVLRGSSELKLDIKLEAAPQE